MFSVHHYHYLVKHNTHLWDVDLSVGLQTHAKCVCNPINMANLNIFWGSAKVTLKCFHPKQEASEWPI